FCSQRLNGPRVRLALAPGLARSILTVWVWSSGGARSKRAHVRLPVPAPIPGCVARISRYPRLGLGVLEQMSEDLQRLVRQRIENLRPKLLDLSRRNPLISTKLGARSASHVRVVDELPDILFFKLNNAQQMEIVPLPAIEEDPRDERTDAFRSEL